MDLEVLPVLHICLCFVLEWQMFPGNCVSATNLDLSATYHKAGNWKIENCKHECKLKSECSAIEWYVSMKECKLVLSTVPATKGSLDHDDPACYIKPGIVPKTTHGSYWYQSLLYMN